MITRWLTPLLVLTGTVLVSHLLFTNPYWLVVDLFLIVSWIEYFQSYRAFQCLSLSVSSDIHRLFVNEGFQVEYTLSNPSRFDFLVELLPATNSYGEIRKLQTISLAKNQTSKISLPGTFYESGIFSLGNALVLTRHPLSLFSFSKSIPLEEEWIVFPQIESLVFRKEALRDMLPGRRTEYRLLEDYTSLRSIRPYESEPIQRIHWKISGKLDQWMVKEFEHTARGRCHLVIDLQLPESIYAREVWSELRNLYENQAVDAACAMIHQLFQNQAAIHLWILGRSAVHLPPVKEEIAFFEALLRQKGEPSNPFPLNETLSQLENYMQFPDTVIILTMHVNETILAPLLRLRSQCSKIILLLMPYGYRENEAQPRQTWYSVLPDAKALLEYRTLLYENQIMMQLISDHLSLTEAISLVP